MSEATEKKEGGEKKEAKAKKAAAPVNTLAEKKKKDAWTLEKCMKIARRFSTENEWAAGAPASHKSAMAHGWLKQCTAGMKTVSKVRKTA